jgi:hypothetical protein
MDLDADAIDATLAVISDYLSSLTNACQASALNVSNGPWRSMVSRTATPAVFATSMQFSPPLL